MSVRASAFSTIVVLTNNAAPAGIVQKAHRAFGNMLLIIQDIKMFAGNGIISGEIF